MTENRTEPLATVVPLRPGAATSAGAAATPGTPADVDAYWGRLQQLRAERRRLEQRDRPA